MSITNDEKMKAIVIHAFGGPEVLSYEDAPVPQAGPQEVLVRIRAASVNPADWKTRRRPFRQVDLPAILGWDIAGDVVKLGEGVENFKVGDAVYGMIRFPAPGSAYAQYASAPVSDIAAKPTNIDYAHAAALPLVALTAWQSLFEKADLKAGQTVFVNGAAGGVGHIAAQLAKNVGARVIGTASAANQDFLRSLGVDEPVDYNTTSIEKAAHDVDIFYDTVGNGLPQAIEIIKPGGTFVSVVPVMQASPEADAKNIKVIGHLVYPNATQLAEIAQLVDSGKLKPTVAATFPLAEVKAAHEMSETNRTVGKIVLLTN